MEKKTKKEIAKAAEAYFQTSSGTLDEIKPGTIYIKKEDVWQIDTTTDPDYMLVHARDEIIKVNIKDKLVLY